MKRQALLPRPINLSFADEAQGDEYVRRLEALLDRGIVPPEFCGARTPADLSAMIDEYRRTVAVSDADKHVFDTLAGDVGAVALHAVTYAWVEKWVSMLKRERGLSPSTIRHRVGALRRCFAWATRKGFLPANPALELPRGYATYTDHDAKLARAHGKRAKLDEERWRRLEAGEEGRIRAVLSGEKRGDRERALTLAHREHLVLLFDLALETAMRMSEIYTLAVNQIDLGQSTVFLDRTKNGDRRNVPLTSVATQALHPFLARQHSGLLFPWWDGSRDSRRRVTSLLSQQFARIFAYAGCSDLRFHDLRHEATCRMYERTKMSDVKISLITGHRDPRMLRRYSNLRPSDLATEMW